MNFSLGRRLFELAQEPSRVALALHEAGSSTPLGVTVMDEFESNSLVSVTIGNARSSLPLDTT